MPLGPGRDLFHAQLLGHQQITDRLQDGLLAFPGAAPPEGETLRGVQITGPVKRLSDGGTAEGVLLVPSRGIVLSPDLERAEVDGPGLERAGVDAARSYDVLLRGR